MPLIPRELLSDWTATEIVTLLERPIFAEGGYGRVRFHHRSVVTDENSLRPPSRGSWI